MQVVIAYYFHDNEYNLVKSSLSKIIQETQSFMVGWCSPDDIEKLRKENIILKLYSSIDKIHSVNDNNNNTKFVMITQNWTNQPLIFDIGFNKENDLYFEDVIKRLKTADIFVNYAKGKKIRVTLQFHRHLTVLREISLESEIDCIEEFIIPIPISKKKQ